MINFSPKRALLHVANQEGLLNLAMALHEQGIELVAADSTAQLLIKHQLPVTEIAHYTRSPDLLDGQIKTLHPAIHAGLLAKNAKDKAHLAKHHIQPFDLLIANVYPFEHVVSKSNCNFATAIDQIDLNTPALIRTAAKNHQYTLVVVSPHDYAKLIHCIKEKKIPKTFNFDMAKKAFAHTAAYDAAISNYLGTLNDKRQPSGFPDVLTCQFNKKMDLTHGENPHQQASFYIDKTPPIGSLAAAEIIHGQTLTYKKLLDAELAYESIKFSTKDTPTCVIVKQGNLCGIASGETQLLAYITALQCTQNVSGVSIAFNQSLQADTVETLLKKPIAEVIIAPHVTSETQQKLANRSNLTVLITGSLPDNTSFKLDMRRIDGGLLVQEHDSFYEAYKSFKSVGQKPPSKNQYNDLLFAWRAVKHVKSNALVIVKNAAALGIGAGQVNQELSLRIALWQAKQCGLSCHDAVLAADACISDIECIKLIADAGIKAIIQPGGAYNDKEIIEAANQHGLRMLLTGISHLKQ